MSDDLYELKPLSAAIAHHVGGGTPPRQIASFWNGEIPWASVKDFSKGAGVITDTEEHISQAGLNGSSSRIIPPLTPLVCTRMAVGRAAIPLVPVAINQDVKALVPAKGVSPTYLLKVMEFIETRADALAIGSTVKGISISEYLGISTHLAPSQLQPVIACILDTVDSQIRETKAIIAKLSAVKQGLLQDFLTRGVDANGTLRPSQADAPHLYKESPLGFIPKEWSFGGLAGIAPKERAVIRTGPFGSALKGEHWRESGRPVVTIGSLGDGIFDTSQLLFVDEATALRLSDFELLPGDIAFSRVADVGRSVVITENERGWIMSSNFMRISCNPEKVRPAFLQMLMARSQQIRKQLRATVNSAGRDVANSTMLMGLVFPWPSPQEQDRTIAKTKSIDVQIINEERELGKQLQIRIALMDDLLTGRVPVTPLLEKANQDTLEACA